MRIEAQGTLQFADVLQATRRLYRHHWVSMLLLSGIGIGFLILGALSWVGGNAYGAPFLIAGVLLATRYWTNSYWFARRQWAKNPNLHQPVRVALDDQGWTLETANERSELKWDAILCWQEEKDVLLLYTSPLIAQILPKRFFGSQLEAARQLIAAKVSRG